MNLEQLGYAVRAMENLGGGDVVIDKSEAQTRLVVKVTELPSELVKGRMLNRGWSFCDETQEFVLEL